MVPYLYKLMEMINVSDKVKQGGFVQKNGVEFLTGQTGDLRRQSFSNLISGQIPSSYNLNRARFDKIILDHAEV